jgi:hypothetical protein
MENMQEYTKGLENEYKERKDGKEQLMNDRA